MRLSFRTGLAAFAAATVSLLVIGAVFQGVFARILLDRVDAQLRDRAETAPILAAVGERLARSELTGTVIGARVLTDGRLTALGRLPDDPLPAELEPGFTSVSADGERWRLYTVEVVDVPEPGVVTLVQLTAPLGDVEAEAQLLRRRAVTVGLLAAVGAGLLGSLLGSVAARPMTALRRDSERLADSDPDPERWRVATSYGSPEVDDVAAALNTSLTRLARETERRGTALEAARAFASSASHELRVPLQAALTNLNLAASGHLPDDERDGAIAAGTQALQRMADTLAALRALAQAELADPAWFEPVDVIELVDAAVAEEVRRDPSAVEIVGPEGQPPVVLWADGVRLALANLVRNALLHGRPADGGESRVRVTVEGSTIIVDDDGPGFPGDDRDRLLERFERGRPAAGASSTPGAGLGLTIARQVATAHGGSIELSDAPGGGARVVLRLAARPEVETLMV